MANNQKSNNLGFAGMSEEEKRKAASKGGRMSGGNFRKDPERASEAGKIGGSK